MPIILQILGENVKTKRKDGTLVYKLGVIYYDKCTHNKTKFKKNTNWWLVDMSEIICNMPQPTIKKSVRKTHSLFF